MRENENENEEERNIHKKKNNFILYHEMYESIEEVSDEIAGKVMKAVFIYSRDKKKPEFKRGTVESILFKQIKNSIDINNEKYEQTCEKNRKNAEKRGEKKKEENQEQEEKIKQDVSVIFIGNDKLTKEEYEKKYDSNQTSFNDILQDQLKYIKEKNIDQLKKDYKCKYISDETIKREYGI